MQEFSFFFLQDTVYIAAPLTGVPKTLHALVAGETREFQEIGGGFAIITNSLMARQHRANLWRSWGSMFEMLPVGGEDVWQHAPVKKLNNKSLTHEEAFNILRGESEEELPEDIRRMKDWLFTVLSTSYKISYERFFK